MGKIMLYTVQGGQRDNVVSTADAHGLSAYLGYRPTFCTKLEKDSLAESWFRIWAASSTWPEKICLFEMDEEDCIPMNVVDWTNTCMSKDNPTEEEIKAVLHDNEPTMTDYLIKEIPNPCFEIPISALYGNEDIFARLFNLSADDPIVKVFQSTQRSITRMIYDGSLEMTGSNGKSSVGCTYENIYGAMRLTGMISLLWALGTKSALSDTLLAIQPENFNMTSFIRAQELLKQWDDGIGEPDFVFTYEQYGEMREKFIATLNQVSASTIDAMAKKMRIGSNDECFCGSGKKFKKCHRGGTMDSLANRCYN